MAYNNNNSGGFDSQWDSDMRMIEQITHNNSEVFAPHLNKKSSPP